MNRLLVSALLCLLSGLVALASPAPGRAVAPRARGVVATSGDKEFWKESDAYTWFAARTYCANQTLPSQMRLAAISLAADFTALTGDTARSQLGAGTIYWTAGRDLQDWGQFKWDDVADAAATDVSIGNGGDGTAAGEPFYKSGFRTCLAFMIMKDGKTGRLSGLDCQTKYPVLCQRSTV